MMWQSSVRPRGLLVPPKLMPVTWPCATDEATLSRYELVKPERFVISPAPPKNRITRPGLIQRELNAAPRLADCPGCHGPPVLDT